MKNNIRRNLIFVWTFDFVMRLGISLFFGLMVTNCSPSNNSEGLSKKISIDGIMSSNLPPEEKAKELTDSAEDILTTNNYVEANKVASLAVSTNPKDVKAGFIKSLTECLIKLKGFVIRSKPLFKNDTKAYENFKKGFSSNLVSEKFFLDGSPEFFAEKDLQEYFDELVKSFENLNYFLNHHKNAEFAIKSLPLFERDLNKSFVDACELKITKQFDYEINCPDEQVRHQINLNRADFEELQLFVNITLIYFNFLNAYDLTGYLEAFHRYEDRQEIDKTAFFNDLLNNKSFGLLRENTKMNQIQNLGIESMLAVRWFMDNPKLACPKGAGVNPNRVGMLFFEGLCIDKYFNSFLIDSMNFFKGVPKDLELKDSGRSIKTKTNYISFSQKPPRDIRDLGPFAFNACGDLISVGDPTMGGIFPNQDANTVLPLQQRKCEK